MTMHSYHRAKLLLLDNAEADFETLLFAAICKAHSGQLQGFKDGFPALFAEFTYRYWCGGGLMPGEEGYDPATDDNLEH